MEEILDVGFMPTELVEGEIKWFYNELGWEKATCLDPENL